MNMKPIPAVCVFLTVLVPVVQTNLDPRVMRLYFRSLAKLCGWAHCQGLCQYRDKILSPREYYDRRCSAQRYNEVVDDAHVCVDALCITNTALSVNTRRSCRPNYETQTACYNLYRNETTGRVQTRLCWDQSPYCMDLVNFCKSQNTRECTSYSSFTTLPPTSTAASGRVTSRVHSTEDTAVINETLGAARTTSGYHNTVTAKPRKTGAFAAGAISGICAAVIPMIIALIVIMCLRRRKRNQFKVSDANKRKDSMQLGGGPVYASIAPELPIRQENARGDISSSARSLHVSAPRANLLGNLQRNKSLPALAYGVNSVPMETNDVLRTVSMANRLSGLSESPSSPRSPLTPNNLYDLQQRQVRESEAGKCQKGRSPVPSWTSEQSIKVNRRDPSRHITSLNGSTGLTNKLYDEAILPGPPSKYAESENGSCHNVELAGVDEPEQTTYTSLQKEALSIHEDSKGTSKEIAECTSLELNTSLDTSTVVPYAVLCPREDIEENGLESRKYASLEPVPQQGTTNTKAATGHQYTEYIGDEDNDDSNEYMGIPEKTTTSQQGSAYMGLQSKGLNATNEYMGIGEGIAGSEAGPITVQVGNGAYAELSLLDRGNADQKSAYMDLHSVATPNTGETNFSEGSIRSNKVRDQGYKSKSPDTKKDNQGKSKFWKSKSVFHRRDKSNDGLTTNKQKQVKPKKSLLFRRKKDKLELSKEETLKSDMCLDLSLSSPSPTYSNPMPQYFTLEAGSAEPHSQGIKQGSNDFSSIPEYQEDGDYDAETAANEPFRSRSQSQPVKQNCATVQCEVYETIR